MEAVIEKLKGKNLKITPQRLAVYNYLYHSQDHPSADLIYKTLEHDWPTLSLATVYKTLDTLTEAGLVRRISTCRDRMRYDADLEPHCHLICVECCEVQDYLAIEIDGAEIARMSESMKFIPMYEEVNFYGVCDKCNAANSDAC